MKRSWIGLGLLLALLAIGIGSTLWMMRIHEPVAADLEQASDCIFREDWEAADRFFRSARQSWEKWSRLRSCFADHTPTEEIDSLFAQLQVYADSREDAAFAAGCRELAKKVSAVGDAHGLYWWNIL